MKAWQNFIKGIVRENPVLVLLLGTCPTLAVTTSVSNAFGMGAAATAVLLGSNVAISAMRKVIPDKVRIPSYMHIHSSEHILPTPDQSQLNFGSWHL